MSVIIMAATIKVVGKTTTQSDRKTGFVNAFQLHVEKCSKDIKEGF